MKQKKLKKSSYIQGAVIATLGIVISKILGILYVIPFYAIIGEQGGALYGYAYNIYSIFLGISSAGIPLAVSKIISEYDALGLYESKEKAFKIAKRILNIMGIICFLVLFILAKSIAIKIIGTATGGNSIEDITFVIRVISLSILVVPILSVYRGYLQGHTYMTSTSVSQVLEQLVRVFVIIVGSYLTLKVFNLPLKYGVGMALFGASLGSLISYLYLHNQVKIHKKELVKKSKTESVVSTKVIVLAIITYAFPFIFGDVCKSLYNSVDVFFVVRTLVEKLSYSITDAESIMSVISTWGNKLNMIIIAIGTGFTVSLLPNLTKSLVKNDILDIRNKINQTIQILVYVTLPMTVGLSFLSEPVWNVFYGASAYGANVFCFSIFTAFVTVFLSMSTTTMLTLKEYKTLIKALIIGLVFKVCTDVPFMLLFPKLTLPAYYGAILSTILGNCISIIIVLIFLKHKYKIEFKETFIRALKVIISVCIMILSLTLLKSLIPLTASSRVLSIFIVLMYSIIGGIIYAVITDKMGLVKEILGKNLKEFIIEVKKKIGRKLK